MSDHYFTLSTTSNANTSITVQLGGSLPTDRKINLDEAIGRLGACKIDICRNGIAYTQDLSTDESLMIQREVVQNYLDFNQAAQNKFLIKDGHILSLQPTHSHEEYNLRMMMNAYIHQVQTEAVDQVFNETTPLLRGGAHLTSQNSINEEDPGMDDIYFNDIREEIQERVGNLHPLSPRNISLYMGTGMIITGLIAALTGISLPAGIALLLLGSIIMVSILLAQAYSVYRIDRLNEELLENNALRGLAPVLNTELEGEAVDRV